MRWRAFCEGRKRQRRDAEFAESHRKIAIDGSYRATRKEKPHPLKAEGAAPETRNWRNAGLLQGTESYIDLQSATGDWIGGGCAIDRLTYVGDHRGVNLVLSDDRLFELTGRAG
jgi:hypothetical protein